MLEQIERTFSDENEYNFDNHSVNQVIIDYSDEAIYEETITD